jgi:hypothetical protein
MREQGMFDPARLVFVEELRRRFGENFRPQLELEYIERLLRDF